jgi:hypothetical protein
MDKVVFPRIQNCIIDGFRASGKLLAE